MSLFNPDLLFEMTTMFIQNMLKPFDEQEAAEEEKREFLNRVVCYCTHVMDKNEEPSTAAAQDGWLKLIDRFGAVHQVAYRGVWTIEQLKNLIDAKHHISPEDQNITIMTP